MQNFLAHNKRFLFITPTLILLLTLGIIALNPNYKTAVFKYYTQTKLSAYNKFAKKVLKLPVPLSFVSQKIIDKKLADPAAWSMAQINSDFSTYTNVSEQNVLATFKAMPADKLVILFSIKNGKLTVTKPDIAMNEACLRGLQIYSNIFEYLAKKGYVTNVSFLLRLSDFFADVPGLENLNLAPILTTSKDSSKNIERDLILIPDYMSLEDIPKLTPRILKANETYPWNQKDETILWRGGHADISGFRHAVVEYSQQHPNSMVDAKFVIAKDEYMPPEMQIRAKYLLNIDGHTAAWTRPIWQLLSNSVFLKQESPLTQWYYQALQPDVHYIAVNNNPAQLEPTISKYADEQLRLIAANGSEFAKENLTIDDMLAYIIMALQKYQALQLDGVRAFA
jgi:hypothetical protein